MVMDLLGFILDGVIVTTLAAVTFIALDIVTGQGVVFDNAISQFDCLPDDICKLV